MARLLAASAAPIFTDVDLREALLSATLDPTPIQSAEALVRRGLASPDNDARMLAESVAATLGLPVADAIAPRLADCASRVRWNAALALGRLRARAHAPDLTRALGDPNWYVRLTAAWALSRLGAPHATPAVPAIRALLDDEPPKLALAAAQALGDLGATRAGPVVEMPRPSLSACEEPEGRRGVRVLEGPADLAPLWAYRPEGRPRAVLVWMHGLGSDGLDTIDSMRPPVTPNLRDLAIVAPTRRYARRMPAADVVRRSLDVARAALDLPADLPLLVGGSSAGAYAAWDAVASDWARAASIEAMLVWSGTASGAAGRPAYVRRAWIGHEQESGALGYARAAAQALRRRGATAEVTVPRRWGHIPDVVLVRTLLSLRVVPWAVRDR